MKDDELILLDEFNLCSESVIIHLLSIFKVNINDEIYLKEYPEKFQISPEFLLIATGEEKEI